MNSRFLNTIHGHVIVQVAATLFQYSGEIEAALPRRWALLLHAVITAGQIILAGWNHFKNPDGTNAATAYRPNR